MVVAVPLAGGSSLASGGVDPVALLWWAGTALGAAVGLGVLRAAVSMLLLRRVPAVAIAVGGLALAALATGLVALG